MNPTLPITVLMVDDDPESLSVSRQAFDQQDVRIELARSAAEGLALCERARPNIVVVSLKEPGAEGDLLDKLLGIDPGLDVILVASHYSAESAVDAIQRGACDYLSESSKVEGLRVRVTNLIADAERRRNTLRLDQDLLGACRFEGIVGRSPLMLELFARVRRVAPHFRTILLTGATGTGKELIAQSLHKLSSAARDRFIVCNCSALVDTLMESQLFGHVRGSFTGAASDNAGYFEHADGGTIFLDEIGELSLAAQAKLLRVLQNRQIQRVGSVATRNIDVRVIAATHRNLMAMVRAGQFREDLYYRLSVVEIHLPTLADRREDLPLLMRHFVEKFAIEYEKPIAGISRRAQLRMASYLWPGNVRELENVIGNACMMVDGNLIDTKDLPERFRERSNVGIAVNDALLSLEEVQKRHILRVLEGVGGNKARAAEVLGIGRATIYQLLSRIKDENSAKAESA